MSTKLFVAGGISWDTIHYTEEGFPHPGTEVSTYQVTHNPGGKGLYQGKAAKRLGADVTLVSSCIHDLLGDLIIEDVRKSGITPLIDQTESKTEQDATSTVEIIVAQPPKKQPSLQNSGVAALVETGVGYLQHPYSSETLAHFITTHESIDGVSAVQRAIHEADAVVLAFDLHTSAIIRLLDMALGRGQAKRDGQEQPVKKDVIVQASPNPSFPLANIAGVKYVIVTLREAPGWLAQNNIVPQPERGQTKLTASVYGRAIHTALKEVQHRPTVIITDDTTDDTKAEHCTVVDQHGTRIYDTSDFKVDFRIGFTGVRSAFCAAFAITYTEQPKENADEVAMLNFAYAERCLVLTRGPDTNLLPSRNEVDNFLRSGKTVKLVQ
jgi:sugar/nucleoside kinase (ribokinase family)